MHQIYFRNIRSQVLETISSPRRGAWLRVVNPTKQEIEDIAKKYKLEVDLLLDGIDLYEAPRIERDNSNLYIYVRYCRPYGEYTSTHPLLIIVTPEMLITVSRTEADPVGKLLETKNIVTTQKLKLVLQLLGELNSGYRRHLNAVTKKILSTRNKLQKTIVSNDDILNFIDDSM